MLTVTVTLFFFYTVCRLGLYALSALSLAPAILIFQFVRSAILNFSRVFDKVSHLEMFGQGEPS
jgi:hypothetical protein